MSYPQRGWWWFIWSVAGWIFLTLLALGVIFSAVAMYQIREGWELRTQGIEVPGQVIDLSVSTRSCGKDNRSTCTDYKVSYDFEAAGELRTDSTTVAAGFYRDLQVGQTLPVRYLNDDPLVNEIELGSTLTGGVFMSVLALGFLGGGGYAVRGRLRLARRMIGLRENGRMMRAVVTERKPSGTKVNNVTLWTLKWRDDAGGTGESRLQKEGQLPQVGENITVYVDPDGVQAAVWEGDCGTR